MDKLTIYNHDFYYLDSNDPVVHGIKNGQLYGLTNYLFLKHYTKDLSGWIIDCGAHIGTFSFVPVLEKHKVLLIEAAKQNLQCLNATFASFDNAIVEKAIVLDKKQNCDFPTNYGPFGFPQIKDEGAEESETIDNICKKHNIDKISMIKIDIEGFEEEALTGATEIISLNKPVMLLEINGYCLKLKNKKPFDILQKLSDINYIAFINNNQTLIPVDKYKKFPFCVTDVLCIHKDKIYEYIGSANFSEYLSDNEITKILEHNYAKSNEDCREYFSSIV